MEDIATIRRQICLSRYPSAVDLFACIWSGPIVFNIECGSMFAYFVCSQVIFTRNAHFSMALNVNKYSFMRLTTIWPNAIGFAERREAPCTCKRERRESVLQRLLVAAQLR